MRRLRAEPHSSNLRKAVEVAGKKLRKIRKAAVVCFYDSYLPNRRLHEAENNEYVPLQAAKLQKQMNDRLAFRIISTCTGRTSNKK